MLRPRTTPTSIAFPPGYVERNPLILVGYRLGLASARFRAFVLARRQSRLRMALLGGFWHRVFKQWSDGKAVKLTEVGIDPAFEGELFFGMGTYQGRTGILRGWDDWREAFPDADLEVAELLDAGHGILVIVVQVRGRGGVSGVSIDQVAGGVYTIREGMVVQARAFSTKAEALEAAGLTEEHTAAQS